MTLVVVAGGTEYVVQLSDRRLTAGHTVTTDESGKAAVLHCRNARVACGFTGLAEVAGFRTYQWIAESLAASAKPDCTLGGILSRFRTRATDTFRDHPCLRHVARRDRRLSILFAGFLQTDAEPRVVEALVTNYQDYANAFDHDEAQDEFWMHCRDGFIPGAVNPSFIERIGMWQATKVTDFEGLRTLIESSRPAEAVVARGVELMREIAARPKAMQSVGGQINAIVIPADQNRDVRAEYFTESPSPHIYQPMIIEARNPSFIAAMEATFSTQAADGSPVAARVPAVHRNAPCPCGSGRRYRNCHRPRKAI